MIVLGIDPGLATVGIGIVDASDASQMRCVDWCTIETAAGLPVAERLVEIERDLDGIIDDCHIDCAVVEKVYFATNQQTAIDVAQARGVLLAAVQRRGVDIIEPTPLQLKAAITGDGKADKKQMQDMLVHWLALAAEDVRAMRDDAADALALGIYGGLVGGKERM